MEPYKIDIPVLLIFFARPKQTRLVFDQIRIARPSKLYLYQDGPRPDKKDDIEKIEECRKYVEAIDWDCKVERFYQIKNIGCDPSEFIAQKWMFSNEEYGIVLEDDDVPSQSFFPFCKELLERFKNDERINIICGMNHLGELKNNPYSYLFTSSGSIWGWASWKRVLDKWEERYNFLSDNYALELLRNKLGTKFYKQSYKIWINDKNSGKAHYESILGPSGFLNSRLNIVPSKNMISNVGIGENATHSPDSVNKLPKGIRQILFMKTHEIEFPLSHPNYIIEDVEYKQKVDKIMGFGYPLISFSRSIRSIMFRIISGDTISVLNGFLRRIKLIKKKI